MEPNDRKDFANAWKLACADKPPRPEEIEFAFRLLAIHPIKSVLDGIARHCLSSAYPIKIADVQRHIVGNPDERAAEAWVKVSGTIESHGPYARITFDDPAIHAALDGGMWISLCNVQSYHDLAFRQKDFEAAYKAMLGTTNYPAVLCAIPSSQERPVQFIGDPEKARYVLEMGSAKQLYSSGPRPVAELISAGPSCHP
jgi:hypothetical protein